MMTMQSPGMHDAPAPRRLTRTSSVDVGSSTPPPSSHPHPLKKRLSRTDSSAMMLSSDPFRYSLNYPRPASAASTASPRTMTNRGLLTRATTISTGMVTMATMAQRSPVRTPPIKIESAPGHVRRLVKQKTLTTPQLSPPVRPPRVPDDLGSVVSTSCPNLAEEEATSPKPNKIPVRQSKSSDGRLVSKEAQALAQQTHSGLLTVPNIFTTSHTRSSPVAVRHSSHRSYRHSAPELAANSPLSDISEQLKSRASLMKSLSDTPTRLTHSQQLVSQEGSVDLRKPRVAKVLDYLYIGNDEAVENERLMCRMSISSIIKLTDCELESQEETGTPNSHRTRWPCPCGSDTKHLKTTLRLQVSGTDTAEFEGYMEQINKFIEGARRANKRVLVQCVTGNSLSVVAVMQYLMTFRCMNLRKAYSLVMKTMSDLYIPPMYKDMLQRLEKLLMSPDDQSLCFDSDIASSPVPMEAWTSPPCPPSSPSDL